MLRQVAFLSLVLAIYGCSSSLGPEEAPATTAALAGSAAIAKIVTRDRSIVLQAGGGTVRVTVLDANGKLIARDVPVDRLQYIDASAYEACHASFAEQRGALETGAERFGPGAQPFEPAALR